MGRLQDMISKIIQTNKRIFSNVFKTKRIQLQSPVTQEETEENEKTQNNTLESDKAILDYISENVDIYYYLTGYSDLEEIKELINRIISAENKVKALQIITSQLSAENMEDFDTEYYYDEEGNYRDTTTRADIFYTLFIDVFNQIEMSDETSMISLINMHREIGNWKESTHIGEEREYIVEKIQEKFYEIIMQHAGEDVGEIMRVLDLYSEEMNIEQIVETLQRISKKATLNNSQGITEEQINQFISRMIEENLSEISLSENISNVIEIISDSNIKLELLKKIKETTFVRSEFTYVNLEMRRLFTKIFLSIDENDFDKRLQLLDEYWESIESHDYSNDLFDIDMKEMLSSCIVKETDLNKKIQLLEKYAGKLYGSDIVDIIMNLNIKEYIENQNTAEVTLNTFMKVDLLRKYMEYIDSHSFARAIGGIRDYDQQLSLLKEYDKAKVYDGEMLVHSLSREDIATIIASLQTNGTEKIKLIQMYQERLNDVVEWHETFIDRSKSFSELLSEIIYSMDDDGILEAIEKFKEILDSNDLLFCIMQIEDEEKRKQKYFDLGYDTKYSYNLAERVIRNVGANTFAITDNLNMLSNELVEVLGEEYLYRLIKYVLSSKVLDQTAQEPIIIDLNRILENPDLFREYLNFMDKCALGEQQRLLASERNLEGYIGNEELFKQFINRQNSETEEKIMEAIFRDRINYKKETVGIGVHGAPIFEETMLIENAEELLEYPNIRKAYYEEKILNNPSDTLYELVLGITKKELEELRAKLKGESKMPLSQVFQELYNRVPENIRNDISNIIAGMKTIEHIESIEDNEQIVTLLRAYNEELAKEFEDASSNISQVRRSMSKVSEQLRTYFGQEISKSLYWPKETKEKEEEAGVEVIHMRGEDFRCLIHAVDAYGKGNGHYEKRERGNAYLCTSMISSQYMGRADGNPIVAFGAIDADAFIQCGARDVFSKPGRNDIELQGHDVRYLASDELLEETVFNETQKKARYNEVNLYREYDLECGEARTLIPDAIICFNTIDEMSILESKRIQEVFHLERPLPIRVIHEEFYTEKIKSFRTYVTSKYTRIQRNDTEIASASESVIKRLEEMLQCASPKVRGEFLQAIIDEMEKAPQEI